MIFRQNTEGLYGGVEWTNPPDQVWQALDTHPNSQAFADVPREDLAVSTRIFTRAKCRRICEQAFAYAAKHGYAVGHRLREAQRDPGDLGHDAGRGPQGAARAIPTSSSGTPTSMPR